jgi:hypothetical protein
MKCCGQHQFLKLLGGLESGDLLGGHIDLGTLRLFGIDGKTSVSLTMERTNVKSEEEFIARERGQNFLASGILFGFLRWRCEATAKRGSKVATTRIKHTQRSKLQIQEWKPFQ